ncbi:MAG: glycoside hydrolase family 95 protein [Bacteroidales bacterium]
MNFVRKYSKILFLALLASCEEPVERPEYAVWFDRPADYFEECFVMGNGKMGASIFGGVNTDSIYLNDITLWSGEPVDPLMNPSAHRYVTPVRQALANEDYRQADRLNRFIQGSYSESYAPAGTVYMDFDHSAGADDYYRELDISSALSRVEYRADGVDYSREYFVSHPDSVMLIRLSAGRRKALNFSLAYSGQLPYDISFEDGLLMIRGRAPYHAEPLYRGVMDDAVLFDKDRGTGFTLLAKIINTGGKVSRTDSSLVLSGGREAVVIISLATSFNGYNRDPAVDGKDDAGLAAGQLSHATGKSYDELKRRHMDDYKSFFDRLSIDLGDTGVPDIPMNERLKRYNEGAEDRGLEEMYLQFGRYLLISSSRTPSVPANLQGLWNPYLRPPWSSNYTMNINLEENYWLAETGNLAEMHKPLLGFTENLAETGKVTARTFYGIDSGWVACHNSDIWAMSNPVGDFGEGHPAWANWNMGAVWLSTHLWEHFAFNPDTTFLEVKAWPLMKGACEFCLGWMVEGPGGYLITAPSTSPENLYLTPDGYQGATLYGATADLAIIRELFDKTLRAAEILGRDSLFRIELADALARLHPYRVGHRGNLQEWYHDWQDADPAHRHQSHLFGLYPGRHISPGTTPALADACRISLEMKGDESTGWSLGWRINLWARLLDGDHAYSMYRQLLRYVDPPGKDIAYGSGGGTYPNLLDAHPPFQIDGNFGGAAGVLEMLVQSDEEKIYLLPALPEAWDKGSVEGVCARGGFELSLVWEDHRLKETVIRSRKGGSTALVYNGKQRDIDMQQGGEMIVQW